MGSFIPSVSIKASSLSIILVNNCSRVIGITPPSLSNEISKENSKSSLVQVLLPSLSKNLPYLPGAVSKVPVHIAQPFTKKARNDSTMEVTTQADIGGEKEKLWKKYQIYFLLRNISYFILTSKLSVRQLA